MEGIQNSEIVSNLNYELGGATGIYIPSAESKLLVAIVDELWCFVLHTCISFDKGPHTFTGWHYGEYRKTPNKWAFASLTL